MTIHSVERILCCHSNIRTLRATYGVSIRPLSPYFNLCNSRGYGLSPGALWAYVGQVVVGKMAGCSSHWNSELQLTRLLKVNFDNGGFAGATPDSSYPVRTE